MWWKFSLVVAMLVVLGGLAVRYGIYRWRLASEELSGRLEAGRTHAASALFSSAELDGLPDPVKAYFEKVLRPGQPPVTGVVLNQSGTFNMSEGAEKWVPFTAAQRVVTQRPGFYWDARINMAPGVVALVHDAYVGGEGMLRASLFGLLSVANVHGTAAMAEGELMRYLAEAAWYPTALLPSQGVAWQAVDEASAIATLEDQGTRVSLLFRFGADGLIESVRSESRGRSVGERSVPTPWEGHWRAYQRRGGMLVPTEGEAVWRPAGGPHPYWRGHITNIDYQFAE